MVRSFARRNRLVIVLEIHLFRHDSSVFLLETDRPAAGLMLAAADRQYLVHAFDIRGGSRLLLIAELATDPRKGLSQVGVDAPGVAEGRIENGFHRKFPLIAVSYACYRT
jgi:hypothetical protein